MKNLTTFANSSSHRARAWMVIPLVMALSGCAFIRSDKPELKQTDINQAQLDNIPANAFTAWPGARWWENYHNPQLNNLVNQALTGDPSLEVVKQRLEIAKAQTSQMEANGQPFMNFGADLERQKMSAEGLMGPFATDMDGNTGPWYTNGTFGLTAGWDLDLWGKDRAQVESTLGVVRAKQAELAQARLMIASNVVHLYWNLQTLMALQDTLKNIQSQEALVVDTEKELYRNGLRSDIEGAEAVSKMTKTQQQLDVVAGDIAVTKVNLKSMMGLNGTLPAIKPVALPDMRAAMPKTLGYQLLAHRPDLQAAHWYIEASLSKVDAAKAAFYPSVDLMGFLQYDALHLSDLFRDTAQQMGVTAGLNLPIFDSGRLNANLAVVRAESNLSIASYNKAVVDAVTEVARNVSQLQSLAQQSDHQQEVIGNIGRITHQAQERYRCGLIGKPVVAQATIPLLSEKLKAIELQGKWINADISLIQSLGGGYQAAVNEKPAA